VKLSFTAFIAASLVGLTFSPVCLAQWENGQPFDQSSVADGTPGQEHFLMARKLVDSRLYLEAEKECERAIATMLNWPIVRNSCFVMTKQFGHMKRRSYLIQQMHPLIADPVFVIFERRIMKRRSIVFCVRSYLIPAISELTDGQDTLFIIFKNTKKRRKLSS
jgi:hypothetical protein